MIARHGAKAKAREHLFSWLWSESSFAHILCCNSYLKQVFPSSSHAKEGKIENWMKLHYGEVFFSLHSLCCFRISLCCIARVNKWRERASVGKLEPESLKQAAKALQFFADCVSQWFHFLSIIHISESDGSCDIIVRAEKFSHNYQFLLSLKINLSFHSVEYSMACNHVGLMRVAKSTLEADPGLIN